MNNYPKIMRNTATGRTFLLTQKNHGMVIDGTELGKIYTMDSITMEDPAWEDVEIVIRKYVPWNKLSTHEFKERLLRWHEDGKHVGIFKNGIYHKRAKPQFHQFHARFEPLIEKTKKVINPYTLKNLPSLAELRKKNHYVQSCHTTYLMIDGKRHSFATAAKLHGLGTETQVKYYERAY